MNFYRIIKGWSFHNNRYVTAIAFLFIAFLSAAQTPTTSLEKLLTNIETTYGVSISYSSDLLKKVSIPNSDINGLPLEMALVKLLRNTDWQFEIISGKYVVIKEAQPDFFQQYRQTYCGSVLDAISHEPLLSANVQIKKESVGTSTDASGRFSLQAIYVPNDSIIISYLGYQSRVIPIAYFKKQNCPTVYLKVASNKLSPIIVENQKKEPNFVEPAKISANRFNIQKIGWIGGQVEKDAFQLIQVLPGVSNGEESATDIHIRGGGSGQNLVLYDGITLYHFGHFFGKVAAVNPAFSEEVTLYKEGISSQYGGRTAGIIDIKSKTNTPAGLSGVVEINSLAGNISFHLPTFNKKGHLLVAYRRSLTDLVESGYFKKEFDQIFQNSRIVADKDYVKADSIEDISSLIPITKFRDLSAKWNIHLSKKDEWNVSYTNMKDALYYDYTEGYWYQSTDTLEINNAGLNISGKHSWHKENYLKGSFSVSKLQSRYLYLTGIQDTTNTYSSGNQNQIKDYAIKLYNHWGSNSQTFDLGYQYNLIKEGHNVFDIPANTNNSSIWSDSIQGQTHALYFDYHFDYPQIFHFNLGVRTSYYNLTNNLYIEPRLFAKIYPKPGWVIKAASGIYYQTINQIVEYNELNSNAKLWILSRDANEEESVFFSVVKNVQFSAGVTHIQNDWNYSLSVYQKLLTGVTSRTINFVEDFPWSTGNMTAKGLEVNVQKEAKRSSFLLSYTLSSAVYDFDYLDYLVPAQYDQRHNVTWVQSFKYKAFTLSSSLKWNTGTPFPEGVQRKVDATDPNDLSYWIEYDKYNGSRLPDYLRWDMNLTWKFSGKRLKGRITIAGLNLLNRRNVLQRNFTLKYPNNGNEAPKLLEISKYGIPFTPNIGISVEF